MRNHHFFTNPKYSYSHVCLFKDGVWQVFEKQRNDKQKYLSNAIAIGTTQGEAIENASAIKGIKHYMIKVIE